jgi:hypothetical protein
MNWPEISANRGTREVRVERRKKRPGLVDYRGTLQRHPLNRALSYLDVPNPRDQSAVNPLRLYPPATAVRLANYVISALHSPVSERRARRC